MTSFIDLMADDVWSEADIVNRTEGMIRGEVSEAEETILSRKMHGYTSGRIVPTAEEAALLDRFEQVSRAAQLAGFEARADMALLTAALAYERAVARLALAAVAETIDTQDEAGEPVSVADPAYVVDQAERVAAQATVDQVSADVLALVEQRAATRAAVADLTPEMEAE